MRLFLLLTLTSACAFPATEIGVRAGAAYRIDIPDNYNGQLLVYCHGYSPRPGQFKEGALRGDLAAYYGMGVAILQSGYSQGGWAVEQAMKETEDLRQYFVSKYGKPRRTIVCGHSMGGHITVALVEKYPGAYDGGLAFCGALEPALTFGKQRAFDALVLFDYYFPGILGSAARPAPEGGAGAPLAAKITAAAGADSAKAEALRQWLGLKNQAEIPGLVSFMTSIQMELVQRTGGNPFDNRDTVYSGGPGDDAVNRGVKRYAADPAAAAYMRAWYTTTGRLERPVLAVHTTYDPVVPAYAPNHYRDAVHSQGKEAFFVQRWVARDGHCTMNPAEMMGAFQDLNKWLDSGVRPTHGEQAAAQP